MSSSVSAHAVDALAARPLLIALAFRDPALEQTVRTMLTGERDVRLTMKGNADVVITDDVATASSGPIVVLSDAAAAGNVLHPMEAHLVAAAARLVAAGYEMTRAAVSAEPKLVRYGLTSREREVALLLLEGASNKSIARVLEISVHTAKFHVAALLTGPSDLSGGAFRRPYRRKARSIASAIAR
jgi:ATP/maltotriose-dependent transcriptional regulator MalT